LSREEAIEELRKQRQSWHTVTQEATLRRLADVTGVSADELYRLNKGRLDGLQLGATLRVGTRLLTAGVDGHEDEEYCHWSFPMTNRPMSPPLACKCSSQRGPLHSPQELPR
jgi:LysM repeat protein